MGRKALTILLAVAAGMTAGQTRPADDPASDTPTPAPAAAPTTRPATQPATRSVPSDNDLSGAERALRDEMERLIAQLRSDRFKERQHAAAELLALHETYLDTLATYSDDADPEVRSRVLDVMRELVAATRIRRVLCLLRDDQSEKLRRFADTRPELFRDMFSLSWTVRISAMRKLRTINDPDGLAEPLLVLSLNHPSPNVVTLAANVAAHEPYGSDALIDALTGVLLRTPVHEWNDWSYDESESPHLAALFAIREIATPRATAALMAILKRNRNAWSPLAFLIADSIGTSGGKGAIPLLLEQIDKSGPVHARSRNGKELTIAGSDPAFLALLKLTHQSPLKYAMFEQEYYGSGTPKVWGFRDNDARKQAHKQFRQWWAEHKDDPEYKDVKPLVLPDLGRGR